MHPRHKNEEQPGRLDFNDSHDARMAVPSTQTLRNTSVPLVPPKPKLFFTATSIFI